MPDNLRPIYDFPLEDLPFDQGSRGHIYRAIAPNLRVLDVGCDTGRFGEILRREKRCVVHGIERDPHAAQVAVARLEKVLIRTIEDEKSFDGLEDYDVVLFLDVLEHLYDPWSVLSGALRVLHPGGVVYGVVPNIAHISVLRRLLCGNFDYVDHGTMDRTHLRWFTRKTLRDAMDCAGFERVTIEIMPHVPVFQATPFIGKLLATYLASLFPDQLAGSLIVHGYKPG